MNNKSHTRANARQFVPILCSALLACAGAGQSALAGDGPNLVDSIVKAPIAFDGDVAYRQSDFVINLAPFANPAGDGIALQAGDVFYVQLPEGVILDNAEEFPVCSAGQPDCQSPSGAARLCAPGTLECTTAVFLQGWPQSPIVPDVDLDGRILTVTARADTGPVVKQLHFIGKGTSNPGPGQKLVYVKHLRGGDAIAEGAAYLRIRRNDHPSINITSVFVGGANTVLQSVEDGPTEFPWNFLVWDGFGQPFMGLTLEQVNKRKFLIRQDGHTVGIVRVKIPRKASGFSLTMVDQGTINTPVIGVGPGGAPPPLTQRYSVQFDAGDAPVHGCYRTTLRLNGAGDKVRMFVGVPDREACAWH